MIIGLYDMDFHTFKTVPFNLEIMKLSSYYTMQNHLTVMTDSFCPDRFSKVFLRKDYNDGNFPPRMIETVEYGGYAYTDNLYLPLESDIEETLPNPMIYERYSKYYLKSQHGQLRKQLTAAHLRLSMDNRTIWTKFEEVYKHYAPSRSLMFHDRGINLIENSLEYIQELLSKNDKLNIGFKFPIVANDMETVLQWIGLPSTLQYMPSQYLGMMEDSELVEFCSHPVRKKEKRQLEYHFSHYFQKESDFYDNAQKLQRQVRYARYCELDLKLYYNEVLIQHSLWRQFYDFLRMYANEPESMRIQDIALGKHKESYAVYILKWQKVQQKIPRSNIEERIRRMKEVFNIIKIEQPILYEDLYNPRPPIYQGGELTYGR